MRNHVVVLAGIDPGCPSRWWPAGAPWLVRIVAPGRRTPAVRPQTEPHRTAWSHPGQHPRSDATRPRPAADRHGRANIRQALSADRRLDARGHGEYLSLHGCRASRPGVSACWRGEIYLVHRGERVSRGGGWAQVPGIRCSPMVSGVAVVAVSVPIDITIAEQLRIVLLRASSHRHAAVVVDLTQTSSCDSAGLRTLVRAHRRARAEGGELRLVVPADDTVIRTLVTTGLHRLIPCFNRLDQALDLRPAARDLTDALAPPPRLAQAIASGRQAGPGGVN